MSTETELELQRSIGRIEGKLDAFIYEVRTSIHADRGELRTLEHRVLRLERWRFYLAGAWAVVIAVITLAWKLLIK